MPRRVSLPGAAELFRPTTSTTAAPQPEAVEAQAKGTGRVRHDEKITVYVSSEELLELERARLALRADHGVGVDRGRIVRIAVGLALADLAANGEDSAIVQALAET